MFFPTFLSSSGKEVSDAAARLVEEQMVAEEAQKPVESAPEGTYKG